MTSHCLFICNKFPPQTDGVGDYTYQLSLALRAKGYDISILTSSDWDGGKTANGWSVYPVVGSWQSPLAWFRILRVASSIQPDYTVLQYVPYAFHRKGLPVGMVFLAAILRFFGPDKFIVFFHEVRIKINPRRIKSLLLGLPMWIISGAIHLLSHQSITSNEAYRRLLRQYGKDAEVIPVGSNIPVAKYPQLPIFLNQVIDEATFVITVFGFDVRGIDILFPAVLKLKEEIKQVKLLLLGKHYPRADERLQAFIHEYGLNAEVITPGFLFEEEISGCLQRSDIFLTLDPISAADRWTGTSAKSGTLAAALAHGKAIIGVRGELTGDFLKEEPILLLDTLTIEALVSAILELYRFPEKKIQYEQKGFSTSQELLSWDSIAMQYEKVMLPRQKY